MRIALIDFSNTLAETVDHAGGSVVSVNEGGRSGVSGTIWRDGLVVTAEHPIRGQHELTTELPTGSPSAATVVGRDPTTDIALLRLRESVPAKIEYADAARLHVGHFILAVGRRANHGLRVSHGIISALGGAWHTWGGGRIDRRFQLDLLPFTGFSGGPLVDVQGRVIGINTSGSRREVITIPAATVNRVVDELLAKGRVVRGFLGVALESVQLPANLAQSTGGVGRGLLVITTEAGGPAEKGGLMIGDIVIAIANQPLTDPSELQAMLDPEQVGKTVQLRVLRGGQSLDLSLIVAERPD